MRLLLLTVALTTITLAPVDAQRKPRTSGQGVPCGNSYIAPGKVCHVGTPSSTKADSTKHDSTAQAAGLGTANSTTALASNPPTTVAGTAVQPASVPVTVNVPPAYADFIAPLKEMIGFKVSLKNPPIDEKWLRNATLTEVHPDHLLLTADGRRIRIPLASIDLYYTDPGAAGELTLAFRK